jgi:hypothetical protein
MLASLLSGESGWRCRSSSPRYGLYAPEFKSSQGQDIFLFSETTTPAVGPTQLPTQGVPVFFPEGKAGGP